MPSSKNRTRWSAWLSPGPRNLRVYQVLLFVVLLVFWHVATSPTLLPPIYFDDPNRAAFFFPGSFRPEESRATTEKRRARAGGTDRIQALLQPAIHGVRGERNDQHRFGIPDAPRRPGAVHRRAPGAASQP